MTFPRPQDVAAKVGADELAEPHFFEAFYRTIRALDDLDGTPPGDVGRWWWSKWLSEAGMTDEAIEDVIHTVTAGQLPWIHRREGVVETLSALHEHGIRMAVISNASGRVAWELEQIGVAQFFETIVDSHVVGVEKPDARIFELTLERMRVSPSETAHVGDVYSIDVVGARGVGITPVHLDPLGLYAHDELRIAHLTELVELVGA